MRVLFVDDDHYVVQTLMEYTKLRGHDVRYSRTLGAAIEILCAESFDVVFLDVMLAPQTVVDLELSEDGRYSGLSLLERIMNERISEFARARTARFVVLTNWRKEPRVVRTCERLGVEVLQKPIELSDLSSILERYSS